MSNFLFYLAAFALVLGVLVVAHEFGHYLAARWCGVKVLRFSFGFGKVIWQRSAGKDRTEWTISAFPLGGYVKMLDEREGAVSPAELHRTFNRQSLGRRSLIVAAGPFANFLMAIVLYWAVFLTGSQELLPILGAPPKGSPAAMAGLQNGQQVRSVDGEAVATWNELRWLLLQKSVERESVELEVIDADEHITFQRLFLAAASDNAWEGDPLERLGVRFFRPNLPPVIGEVSPGGPAAAAGLRAGDLILSIDDQVLMIWNDLVRIVRSGAERSLKFEFQRQGETATVYIVPAANIERGEKVGKIGVAVADSDKLHRPVRTFVRYGFVEAGHKALRETWEKTVFSLVMFGKMLVGEVSLKNLSGPVTIADYAGQSARMGLEYYLRFMALVSISLGVLNLLPIPVLDGGHLMYHMIEAIRRRPLSERAMEITQRFGLSILFVLMAFAFFNDLNRLFYG